MSAALRFGLDRLLADPALRRPLAGRRVALLAHPASVTRELTHSLDALAALPDLRLSAAFGPQHGLRGDKQDNMVESPDYVDPLLGIPVFSLYGEVRRPTAAMMDSFDVLLVDLQDLGCRIYTFITTLRYVLEEAACHGKSVWVLDRPNPAGRPVEGTLLRSGWESFVGAGPLPMRHGLTMGELANWFVATLKLDVDCRVIDMEGWQPDAAPGYGWPLGERSWINPSPNAPNLWMARAYAGTVMLEGTTLSEGRGTTRPLELFGAPDLDARATHCRDARAGPRLARRLRAARVLVRAHLPQARRQAVPRRAHPRRGPGALRPRRLPPLAAAGARLQGDPPAAAGLPAVARLRLRVRARAAGDRPHQRLAAAARMGRRPGCGARRPRRPGERGRGRMGRNPPHLPAPPGLSTTAPVSARAGGLAAGAPVSASRSTQERNGQGAEPGLE